MNTLQQNHYMKQMAARGHYGEALGEAAMALAKLWEKADLSNRRRAGGNLVNEFFRVLTQVWGLPNHEARQYCDELKRAFREA